jgi:hypothetical protein
MHRGMPTFLGDASFIRFNQKKNMAKSSFAAARRIAS